MIVVTSGGSELGRLVVYHLLRRVPASRVTVTAAEPKEVEDLAELGVGVRPEDFTDPAVARRAFEGAERALIIAPPGRFGSGIPVAQAIPCADAAIAAGVRHLAYTSVVNVAGTHHLLHHATEGHIRNAGVPFTFLRTNLQSEALLPALRLALSTGEFVCSFGGELVAPAARTDYAEAAAIVLTGNDHHGAALELTGPLGLKDLGVASAMSKAAGREIAVRAVAPEDLATELARAGATPDPVAELAGINNDIQLGEWSKAADTLETVLGHGRKPLAAALRTALAA